MIGKIAARIANESGDADPFSLYFAGLALLECDNVATAVKALERSVTMLKGMDLPAELIEEINNALKMAREKAAAGS